MGIRGRRGRDSRADQQAPGRDRIAAAMSWLANCLIEGFAAYGNAFYPSFAAMGETEDFGEGRWNEGVKGRDDFALRNNPWLCEDLRESAERETRLTVPQGWMC